MRKRPVKLYPLFSGRGRHVGWAANKVILDTSMRVMAFELSGLVWEPRGGHSGSRRGRWYLSHEGDPVWWRGEPVSYSAHPPRPPVPPLPPRPPKPPIPPRPLPRMAARSRSRARKDG